MLLKVLEGVGANVTVAGNTIVRADYDANRVGIRLAG